MNAITDTWRQLVRRRLWPVALLLVGAIVAVPTLLAKDPEPVASAPVVHATRSAEGTTFVDLAQDAEDAGRRRVLGEAKDPFAPAPLPKAKKAKHPKKTKKTADTAPAQAPKLASAPSQDSAPSAPAGPVAPPVATPPAPKKTYPLYSIKVRFGKTDGAMSTKTLERDRTLPSISSPVLVYEGVEDGGKVAVFTLTGDVTAQGDGHCDPDPDSCETLKLRVGDTEFLDVKGTGGTDAQYELDLETIHTDSTTSAAAAKASRAGRDLRRSRHASLK